jgi:hypothetical protein
MVKHVLISLGMSLPKKDAENKIEALTPVIQEHICLLLGLPPCVDSHHWLNNGVLAPLARVYQFSLIKGNKRIKKDWLLKTLHRNYFGEYHSCLGNWMTNVIGKPEYKPLVTESTFMYSYPTIKHTLEHLYAQIIDCILQPVLHKDVLEKIVLDAVEKFHSNAGIRP